MCTCCGTHLFDSCSVFSMGFQSMEKHPPLFTKVPLYIFQRFKVSFLQISCSGTPPFSRKFCCAIFAHINTEPSHLCKFQSFFYIKMQMTSHSVCYQSFSKTYFEKQNTIYIYVCIFQHSNWRTTVLSFSVCTFLSPHNTFFSCKTLVVICTTHLFTKAPSFQGSSMALKKNIVYKGCSPSIGCASGTTPFFEGKERKQVKNKTNKK